MPREMDSGREGISVGDFVRLLWSEYSDLNGADREGSLEALMDFGRRRGWLEAQDLLEAGNPLLRRQAARILHEFIRRELGEADEADWGDARELADLYDCRVCANHVAQVYAKGIMEAGFVEKSGRGSRENHPGEAHEGISGHSQKDSLGKPMELGRRPEGELPEKKFIVKYFGMEERVSPPEAGRITARALDKARREKPSCPFEKREENCRKEREGFRILRITKGTAEELLRREPAPLFWDVRSRTEYGLGHLPGAVNVPMMEILDAPEKWAALPENGVILGCDGGYRSQAAAECLAQAGCREVYFLGWEAEEGKDT